MRKPVKKGQRFDILKRDCFTCQYCGRKPPSVILHVDHILAVSAGGLNSDDNLITACADCNLGKSSKPMERIKAPINFSVEERAEKLEQLKKYQEFLQEQAEFEKEILDQVIEHWITREGQDPRAEMWSVPADLENAAARFLKKLSPNQVMECMDLAFSKLMDSRGNSRVRFFCGCCWRLIREDEDKKV